MRTWKKGALCLATFTLLTACVACAPKTETDGTATQAAGAANGVTVSQETLKAINGGDNAQWAQEFPDEYLSYLSGVDEIEPSSTPDSWMGDVHSHASLRNNLATFGAAGGQVPLVEQTGSGCISCKSVYVSEQYQSAGMDAFTMPYDDIKDKINYWDCLNCHVDKPGGELKANLTPSVTLMRNFPGEIGTKEAVCIQCHNTLTPYLSGTILQKTIDDGKTLEDVDPYRYGVDPESILKAELEDGAELMEDETSGVQWLDMPLAEAEIFQGSNHQSLGLMCEDCHMTATTNDAGDIYTDHNVSQSPLDNEKALEKCLTCHKGQGIDSTDGMRDWVHDRQNELAAQQQALADKLASVSDAVAQGMADGTDAAKLDQARDNYLHAKLYLDFSVGAVQTYGQKIAHNPDAMRDYAQRGTKLADEALALF